VLAGLGQLDPHLRNLVGRKRNAGDVEIFVGDQVIHAGVDAGIGIVLGCRVEETGVGIFAVGSDLYLLKPPEGLDKALLLGAYAPDVTVPEPDDRYFSRITTGHVLTSAI
jgi:hypothetical protein